MRTRRSGPLGLVPRRSEGRAPTLPPWKAFVVQLSGDTVPGGVFAGRIEHLSSGRRVRFDSQADLLAIIERLLSEIEDLATQPK